MKPNYNSPKSEWGWFPKKKPQTAAPKSKALKLTPTELSPQGFSLELTWPAAAGASKARIEEAELRIRPANYIRSLGQVTSQDQSGNAIDLDLKTDAVLRFLYLDRLKSEDITLAHAHDLSSRSWRLLCSAKLDGAWVPLYAVPEIQKRGAVPAMLDGAVLSNALLKLPATVRARHWRIEVVEGSRIEDLIARPVTLEKATAKVIQAPQDLKVIGPGDQELWAHQGPWQAPEARISLKVPLEQALEKKLPQDATPLTTAYRLTGAQHSKVHILSHRVRGHLLREKPGVWEHVLEGEAKPLAFDPGFSDEQPTSAKADLTLTYLGIRLLDLPASTAATHGKTSGRVIAGGTTVVALPQRLFGPANGVLAPARLGIFGRAVETCELVASFRDLTSGRVIGEPAVLEIKAGQTFQNHLFHFLERPFQADLPQLEITATRGRFYWVGGEFGALKFAVYDANPGNRLLSLNNHILARVSQAKIHQPNKALPAAVFQGQAPHLRSSLFMKVELTDLQLRYSR